MTVRALGLVAWASLRLRMGYDTAALGEGPAMPASRKPADPALVDAAVRRASRFVPGARCLAEAIAARAMLRSSGDPVIRFSVTRDDGGNGPLQAHAWVEIAGARAAGDPPQPGSVTLQPAED